MHTQGYVISGIVQGVGFRWSTVQLANRLGVTGTVANLATGQVAVEATGTSAQLTQFQAGLHHLNDWARVDAFTTTALPLKDFTEFRIIFEKGF